MDSIVPVSYHCTRRVDPNCQQKSTREEELEELLLCGLKEIQIPKQLHIWVIKELKKMHAQEIRERGAQQGARRRQYDSSVQKLDNLIKMRANGELSEDEFKSSKESAAAEKATFKRLLDDVDNRINDWIQIAEKCFDFASKAKHALETGTSEAKSNIISALGSNLTLKDKKDRKSVV